MTYTVTKRTLKLLEAGLMLKNTKLKIKGIGRRVGMTNVGFIQLDRHINFQ